MVLENWEKDRKRNQFWEETYNMTAILFSALAALGGGLVMGVTGFGAGMVIMMVLPVFYSLTESAAISGVVCTVLNAQMAIRYWKHIHFQTLVAPTIAYMILCALLIRFSTEVDQSLIQKGFGIFLICLCIDSFFFTKGESPAQEEPRPVHPLYRLLRRF